jgi:hypothetical protein
VVRKEHQSGALPGLADEYSILGTTLDDSVGEAFDKVPHLAGVPHQPWLPTAPVRSAYGKLSLLRRRTATALTIHPLSRRGA